MLFSCLSSSGAADWSGVHRDVLGCYYRTVLSSSSCVVKVPGYWLIIRFGSSSPITLTVFAPWVLIQCSDPNFLSSWEMWSTKFCNTVEYIWQIQASCLLIEHTPKFQVRFYNAFETKHAPEAFPRSQLAHWTDILCVCEVFCPSWEEWPGVLGVPDCRPSWWLDVKYLANFKRTSTIKNLICAKPI